MRIEKGTKHRIILWTLRGIGWLSFATCVVLLIRGRDFIIAFGRRNPPPLLCLASACICLAAAYLMQKKGPPQRLRIANLILMSFSFLLFGSLAEVGIRMFLQKTQGFNSMQQMFNPNPDGNLPTTSHHPLLVITQLSADKRLIYELKPNLDLSFGHNELKTNSAGMRESEEFSLEKPEGTLRIVGLGDSGMWGWNLHQGNGYMEVLEQKLNAESTHSIEVLNFAVPGYNTYQELQTLQSKGLAYQPDVVVIGWCDNDYQLPFFMYSRRDHWKEPGSYLLSLMVTREAFLEKMTPEVLKIGDIPENTVDPEVIEFAGEAGVRKSLEVFKQLSEEHQFKLLLFGPLRAEILEICEEVGIETLNSFDLREQNPPEDCHVFYMHPSACGHEILGNFLAEELQARNWIP